MKIVSINSTPPQDAVTADAVKILEETLGRVKKGELVTIGISWVTSEQGIGGVVSEGPAKLLMSAALHHSYMSFYLTHLN